MAKKEEKKSDDKKEDKKAAAAEGKDGAEGEATEGAEGEGGKKKLDKKMIIIIAVAAVVLLGGIAAALVFTGVLGGKKPEAGKEQVDGHGEAAKEGGHGEAKSDGHGEGDKKGEHGPIFYDMGEVVVNLQTDGKRQVFLKLVMQLELEAEEDKATIEKIKPRIIDNFQTYLRELRLDDLRGSAGLYRLREELLFRVTEAAQPVKVKDVLIQQMLVQ